MQFSFTKLKTKKQKNRMKMKNSLKLLDAAWRLSYYGLSFYDGQSFIIVLKICMSLWLLFLATMKRNFKIHKKLKKLKEKKKKENKNAQEGVFKCFFESGFYICGYRSIGFLLFITSFPYWYCVSPTPSRALF